ncbi:transposase [Enterobacter cloacae]|uniref:Integrase catalytic domain-containing protein n=1 Tax=Enterobacter cloacae TaxID=550 RepID=A0A3R8YVA1_ENTCL|nr:transposase [Enterobacter cloacae]RSB22014.1 hypothetical protein EGK68_25865 [Enterobacter cloacae]
MNHNAHLGSLFRTLKYVPASPEKGFSTLGDARVWVESFVSWYNEEHRHSGIRYVTPGQLKTIFMVRTFIKRFSRFLTMNGFTSRQPPGRSHRLL